MLWLVAAALLQVQPEPDSAEKYDKFLFELANTGRFLDARSLADAITKKYPGTKWSERAAPFLKENGVYRVVPIETTGPESNRLDLSFMADGVSVEDRHQAQWEKECDTTIKTFFASEPMKEYRRFFNVYRINVVSKDERINPNSGAQVTALGGREEEDITVDTMECARAARATSSRDDLCFVNVRPAGNTHGKSGYGVAVAGGPRPTRYRVLHAWGHALAGLADETNQLGNRRRRPEEPPEAPNVSASDDPTKVPWKYWIAARLRDEKRAKTVDIIEGAARMEKGAWRPVREDQCVMNQGQEYCPICREALVLAMYTWVRPIETSTDWAVPVKAPAEIKLALVQPSHRLVADWFVEKTGEKKGADAPERDVFLKDGLRMREGHLGPRTGLGPSWKPPAAEKAAGVSRDGGVEAFETSKLGKGRWKVTVVVSDPTDWVAHDPENLLKDTRTWIVDVE